MPLPLLPVAIVGLGAAAAYVNNKRRMRGMTGERGAIYASAMASGTPAELNALADVFDKEDLKPQAESMRQRAKLRALPPNVKRARSSAFAKAMQSNNIAGVANMAAIYRAEGCTGAAAKLEEHATFLKNGVKVAPPAPVATSADAPSPDTSPHDQAGASPSSSDPTNASAGPGAADHPAADITTVAITAQGTPAAVTPAAVASLSTPTGVSPIIQTPMDAPGTPKLADGSAVPSVGSEVSNRHETQRIEVDEEGRQYLVTDETWTDDDDTRIPLPPTVRRPGPREAMILRLHRLEALKHRPGTTDTEILRLHKLEERRRPHAPAVAAILKARPNAPYSEVARLVQAGRPESPVEAIHREVVRQHPNPPIKRPSAPRGPRPGAPNVHGDVVLENSPLTKSANDVPAAPEGTVDPNEGITDDDDNEMNDPSDAPLGTSELATSSSSFGGYYSKVIDNDPTSEEQAEEMASFGGPSNLIIASQPHPTNPTPATSEYDADPSFSGVKAAIKNAGPGSSGRAKPAAPNLTPAQKIARAAARSQRMSAPQAPGAPSDGGGGDSSGGGGGGGGGGSSDDGSDDDS